MYPDTTFRCGDLEVSITSDGGGDVAHLAGPKGTESKKLTPVQWAQLIAAIAAAIAQILGGFTASAKDTASEPKGAKAG